MPGSKKGMLINDHPILRARRLSLAMVVSICREAPLYSLLNKEGELWRKLFSISLLKISTTQWCLILKIEHHWGVMRLTWGGNANAYRREPDSSNMRPRGKHRRGWTRVVGMQMVRGKVNQSLNVHLQSWPKPLLCCKSITTYAKQDLQGKEN